MCCFSCSRAEARSRARSSPELFGVRCTRARQSQRQQPKEKRTAEQVGDELDVGVRAQLASSARLRQAREQRLAPRADDPIGVDVGEHGVLVELAEDAGEEAGVQRIRERAREVAEPVEEERVQVFRAPRVEVGRQLAQRVGDQLLLRAPPAVDRVPSDPGPQRDRLDRRRLEAPPREAR
jgi:hypothetical protein